MKTIREFIEENKIRIKSEQVDHNPNFADQKFKGLHYKVTLLRGKKQLTTYFSKGIALTSEPDVAEVLDCLVSDSTSIEGNTFESWCEDLGYDSDSRTAERTFKACNAMYLKLKSFLGDLYPELIQMERL